VGAIGRGGLLGQTFAQVRDGRRMFTDRQSSKPMFRMSGLIRPGKQPSAFEGINVVCRLTVCANGNEQRILATFVLHTLQLVALRSKRSTRLSTNTFARWCLLLVAKLCVIGCLKLNRKVK